MTVEQLIRTHNANYPNSHFFDRDALRFFGERISEMRVLKGMCKVSDGLAMNTRHIVCPAGSGNIRADLAAIIHTSRWVRSNIYMCKENTMEINPYDDDLMTISLLMCAQTGKEQKNDCRI